MTIISSSDERVEKLIAEKHDLLNKIEHEHSIAKAAECRRRLKEIDAQLLNLAEYLGRQ